MRQQAWRLLKEQISIIIKQKRSYMDERRYEEA